MRFVSLYVSMFSGRDLAADVGCYRILAEEDSWDSLTRILTDLRKEQTTSVSSALKIFSTLMIEGFWKKNYELNNNRLIKCNFIGHAAIKGGKLTVYKRAD